MTRQVVSDRYDGILEPIDGLETESTYVWGLLRCADGNVHQLLRRFRSAGDGWPSRLMLISNRDAAGMRPHPNDRVTARRIDVTASGDPRSPTWHCTAAGDTLPLMCSVSDDGLTWAEGPLVDLTGDEVGPGLQWCLPPSRLGADDGMRYASRIFRSRGEVDGVHVEGFVGVDIVQLAPGRQNYIDDPITTGHLSDAWCTWANEWDDGSIEVGHLAFGRDGFGFAIRADGVEHLAITTSCDVTVDDRGRPVHIVFGVDDPAGDETWEFVAEAGALAADPFPGPVRQAEGWFRRVGETRQPVAWSATPEIPAPTPSATP